MDYGPVPNKMDMCVLERERGRESEEEGGRGCVCENLMVKRSSMSLNMYENIKCNINIIDIELLKLMWPHCNARAFF